MISRHLGLEPQSQGKTTIEVVPFHLDWAGRNRCQCLAQRGGQAVGDGPGFSDRQVRLEGPPYVHFELPG